MMNKQIGLDLGARHARFVTGVNGIVASLPSAVALGTDAKGEKKPLAYGNDALSLLDRIPGGAVLSYPLEDRAHISPDVLTGLIANLLRQAFGHKPFRPDIALALPGKQQDALEALCIDACRDAGCGDVYLIDPLLAAAYGAEANIDSDIAVVNIGASLTDAAIYSHGAITTFRSGPAAGLAIERAICDYTLEQYGIEIGEKEAEQVLTDVVSLAPDAPSRQILVTGKRTAFGLPRSLVLETAELAPIVESAVDPMIDMLLALIGDVRFLPDKMILTGGCAPLPGLADLLSQVTDIPVLAAPNSADCIALGLSSILLGGDLS